MKRITLTLLASATLATVLSPAAHAADWLGRAAQACAIERIAAPECDGKVHLVRTAMAAAAPASNGNGSNGSNGGSGHGTLLEQAGAAVAAYVVLERYFPEQQPDLERLLAIQLAGVPESQAKADALARGRRVAESLVASR